jgi:hypothetical protein
MADAGGQQGINTAIASGAAFGGGGQGAANPKAFQGALTALGGIKGLDKAAGALFGDVQISQASLGSTGGGIADMFLGKLGDRGGIFKGLFDMFETGKDFMKILADKPPTNASDSNASSGGGGNAHSAVAEIANPLLEAGMVYRGEYSMAQSATPDNTPRRGAGRNAEMSVN